MKNFEISADSTCDLYAAEAQDLGVTISPLDFVVTNGGMVEYKDDFKTEQQYKDFYNLLRSGAISKTSILNLQAHIDLFTNLAKRGVKKLIHFSQGSGLSPTIDNANKAIEIVKQEFPDINFVAIDTNTTTVGEGALVRAACKMRDNGASLTDTVNHINSIKNLIQHFVVVDDLNHLKRGGRVSALQATFGTLLQVKPIIEMSKAGKLEVVRKERGLKKAIKSVVEEAKKYTLNADGHYIIVHTDNLEGAEIFKQVVKAELGADAEIRIMGPIIGTHVGPNSVALCFISNEERPL